jgi:hypothetical protein
MLAIVGAVVAMLAVAQPTARAGSSSQANTGKAASTATRTRSVPTATPTPRPVPTGMPTPVRQATQVSGTITSVGSNGFQLRHNGTTVVIVVDNQTAFRGDASSLSGLQTGWHADVSGVYQTGGTFLATTVDSSSDT